jgi:hypothetical protein
LHTWTKSAQLTKESHGALNINDEQNSNWFGSNQPTTQLVSADVRHQGNIGIDEEIQMIPVEDIISIKVASEIKIVVDNQTTRTAKDLPPEDLSCCETLQKCCIRRVCYCCCTEKKVAPEFVENTQRTEKAARRIVVTIKHVRHSNVDTPTNVRVLSAIRQAAFYEEQLAVDTVKFYYLHNTEVEKNEYNKQLQDSETLARIIIQLKAMNGHYPDVPQLEQIINQQQIRLFGIELDETLPAGNATVEERSIMAVTNSIP